MIELNKPFNSDEDSLSGKHILIKRKDINELIKKTIYEMLSIVFLFYFILFYFLFYFIFNI
jgi:hypothetical protein